MAGDRFQEMYSFWVEVVSVDDTSVCVRENRNRIRWFSRADYPMAYKYKTRDGYWVIIDRRAGEQVPYRDELPAAPADPAPTTGTEEQVYNG